MTNKSNDHELTDAAHGFEPLILGKPSAASAKRIVTTLDYIHAYHDELWANHAPEAKQSSD